LDAFESRGCARSRHSERYHPKTIAPSGFWIRRIA
jgi:hypothetical protein